MWPQFTLAGKTHMFREVQHQKRKFLSRNLALYPQPERAEERPSPVTCRHAAAERGRRGGGGVFFMETSVACLSFSSLNCFCVQAVDLDSCEERHVGVMGALERKGPLYPCQCL